MGNNHAMQTTTENPQINAGRFVRLKKLSAEAEGLLPTGYWLEGATFSDIVVGRPIKVVRSSRSREHAAEPEKVYCTGMFSSTPVQEILQEKGKMVAKTFRSHWEIELIEA